MATSASGGNSFCACGDRLPLRLRPKMPQQRVKDCRARLADFAPAHAGAMLQFEPVRLDLEKALVAGEFFRRIAVWRRRQTRPGVGFNFFDQILHGRK